MAKRTRRRYDKTVTIRTNDAFKEKLLDVIRCEPDVPPEAEMLRRLVDRAHAAAVMTGALVLDEPRGSKSAKRRTGT